ncbi:uncharacterized protein BJ171DRAFT_311889 [Polychytrium aggregatum]|uniref:uncharacterized protein n=1 Tax=Polychytrium aggregatum TaxID=110093 RepID=UPI0022FE9524|nr:uncharacterized protein BJ171DRAFT_311889 [Polychytrium aggregatum]KAI9207103.1 hypothetical protein BJ171DRAFT_311889 [Polychytrium aggregatum]
MTVPDDSPALIHDRLDEALLSLLDKCDRLQELQARAHKHLASAFWDFAKAKYVMGPERLCSFQYNRQALKAPDPRACVAARSATGSDEGDAHPASGEPGAVDSPDELVLSRKSACKAMHQDGAVGCDNGEDKPPVARDSSDPLNWFGVLSPQSLKDAQRGFSDALEVLVEIANLNHQIRGQGLQIQHLESKIDSCPCDPRSSS